MTAASLVNALSTNVAGLYGTRHLDGPGFPCKYAHLTTRRHTPSRLLKIYDIFEGTAEIQQLVISRAISGMQIR